MKRIVAASVMILAANLANSALADVIIDRFPDFSGAICNGADLTCNGNAALVTTSDGRVLRLTPALFNQSGSAFSTSQIALGAGDTFSTFFQFRFTQPGGIDPADGITFTLQTVSNTAGGAGGGMGYAGLTPSVAIEFDTFNNGGNDGNSSNHIAIDIDGHIIDPFGGRDDLGLGVVRAVGKADERFAEDGLRVLRAGKPFDLKVTLGMLAEPPSPATP